MKRSLSLLLASAMALSGTLASLPPAAAMPVAGISAAVTANDTGNPDIIQAKLHRPHKMHAGHRGGHNGGHGGHHAHRAHASHYRAGHRYGGYDGYGRYHRYHHSNAGVAVGIGIGAVAGALLASPGTSDWTAACARKYRSFEPASGTFLGRDGYRHQCVLP